MPTPAPHTFTFPSGATVDLPAGFTPCRTPEAVTFDCARSVPVGTTPAGRTVFSSFTCAAYHRAAHVYSLVRQVDDERAQLARLVRDGKTRNAAHLQGVIKHHEARNARILAAWTADPAPCTCPASNPRPQRTHPPVDAF